MRSRFFRTAAAAILWIAAMVVMAQPAGATTSGDTFLVAVSADGTITTKPSDPALRDSLPGNAKVVNLPGKTRTGATTNIVCYVYSWGPETDGRTVSFEVMLLCQGGVPYQLSAKLDIYHVYLGEWQVAPNSHTPCGVINDPYLTDCVARTNCFQAGNNYFGYAELYALDDEAVEHNAYLYTYPVWLGCVI